MVPWMGIEEAKGVRRLSGHGREGGNGGMGGHRGGGDGPPLLPRHRPRHHDGSEAE